MKRQTLIAAAIATLVTGCASWFEGSSANQPTPLERVDASRALNVRWQQGVESAGQGLFRPAFLDGKLAVAGNGDTIEVYDAASGKRLESIRLKGESLVAGVGADARGYYAGNAAGEVLAVDAAGKVRWRQRLTSLMAEPPLTSGGMVVVRSSDGRITAYAAEDGRSLWTQWQAPPSLMVQPTTPVMLAVGEDVLISGEAGGKLAVYNLKSGVPLWQATVATPRGASELERVTDVVSQPQFDGRRVCAVAYQGRVACFDARGGNLIWAREVGSSRGLALDGNKVFVTADDGAVWAFDAETGRNLWKNDALKYRGVTGPVRLGKDILVLDAEGYAHLLAPEDGRIVGRARTGAEGTLSQPLVLGDAAFVQGRNGKLSALN